ncbi:DUF1064 domain-containing protein [Oscillibacter valericigenes]|nr:DUF1064 domain-containing protein [Oscillibacter valericigenes]
MAISLGDLPPKYKAQAVKKWAEQVRKKTGIPQTGTDPPMPEDKPFSKYHAQRVDTGHLHFDSKKEARRFDSLALMEQAGEIKDLRLQVDFTLQEAYTTTDGQRVRAIRYRADFTYLRRTKPDVTGQVYWLLIVEDVKSRGTRTKEYLIKRKMMADKFGIDIREV